MHGMRDFTQAANEARERLLAELDRTAKSFEEENLQALRQLSEDLLETATALRREVARLAELADATKSPPPESPVERETPLAVIDSIRDSIAETPIDLAPRGPRFAPPEDRGGEIPEGVQVFVEQLRVAGEDDFSIAKHLEQIGVENPALVVSRIPRVGGSVAAES